MCRISAYQFDLLTPFFRFGKMIQVLSSDLIQAVRILNSYYLSERKTSGYQYRSPLARTQVDESVVLVTYREIRQNSIETGRVSSIVFVAIEPIQPDYVRFSRNKVATGINAVFAIEFQIALISRLLSHAVRRFQAHQVTNNDASGEPYGSCNTM